MCYNVNILLQKELLTMEFLQPYISMWTNYVNFKDRARRRDFWMAFLVNFIVVFILGILVNIASFFGIISGIYSLAILIPMLGLWVRRLHDTGKSGWFLLLGLIPAVGAIILLVFACMDSQPGANQYGPNPKGF
ncbi:DUF805 domain-containing protein [Anaeromassilibacillus senegalensis]|uniref:DUF805 domain-containing protein n=1 Tax=Anaeromassilibacillus senegalensis TaxID=1673717 RepID=UPI002E8E347E|nr:DUF805 domain-containing protein [Anaeromassilibacillus senegalensis]